MHLTDEQLNEYLDNESNERDVIESHLASCGDCTARLTALQALFAELDSLPELELTHSIAARFTTQPNLIQQPPAWLTLTAVLQTVVTLVVLAVSAPIVMSRMPPIETPSLNELLLRLQAVWLTMPDLLSSFQFPALPQLAMPELPSLMLASVLAAASLLWLVGNGLLLRRQVK
jgi:anti-sigma factor RsiW